MFHVLICMFQMESCEAMDTPCGRLKWFVFTFFPIVDLVVFHKTCYVPLHYVYVTIELYIL